LRGRLSMTFLKPNPDLQSATRTWQPLPWGAGADSQWDGEEKWIKLVG